MRHSRNETFSNYKQRKKKDFIDIYFLLKGFSLSEMLHFYKQKYADGTLFLVLKSLTYFEDAEEDEMPLMLIDIKWTEVKDFIMMQIKNYFIGKSND